MTGKKIEEIGRVLLGMRGEWATASKERQREIDEYTARLERELSKADMDAVLDWLDEQVYISDMVHGATSPDIWDANGKYIPASYR